jgi:hypothetical protein
MFKLSDKTKQIIESTTKIKWVDIVKADLPKIKKKDV